MHQPHELLTEESCLVMMTDASDEAVGQSLFKVNKGDANDVVLEDLSDPEMSSLLACKNHRLSGAQRRWSTFEAELFGIVDGICAWEKIINPAIQRFPKLYQDDFIAKFRVMSDSTTGISQWKTLHIPEGALEHLSAKGRRFNSWADKVSYCRYWPMIITHLPGKFISLAHVLSHIADLYLTHAADMKKRGATAAPTTTVMPISVQEDTDYEDESDDSEPVEYYCNSVKCHSYHGPRFKAIDEGIPSDYAVKFINLTPEQVDEINRAMLADDTECLSVPLCDIYKETTTDHHPEVATMQRKKINAWKHKRFFTTTYPGTDKQVLLTQTSSQILTWSDDDDDNVDLTKTLVLVIPK